MPTYSEEFVNKAKEWFENFKLVLKEKKVDFNDPVALSRIQILKPRTEEQLRDLFAEKMTVKERSKALLAQFKELGDCYDYAFLNSSDTNYKMPSRTEGDDVLSYIKDNTKSPDILTDDHICYLYDMALQNRLWYCDFSQQNMVNRPKYHIRVTDTQVEYDDKVSKDYDGDNHLKKAEKPISIGNAAISHEFSIYSNYNKALTYMAQRALIKEKIDEQLKIRINGKQLNEDEIAKLKIEIREQVLDEDNTEADYEKIKSFAKEHALEHQDHYTDEAFEKLNTIQDSLINEDSIIKNIQVFFQKHNMDKKMLSEYNKTSVAAKKEYVEEQILFLVKKFPDYFADAKNRKKIYDTISYLSINPTISESEKKKILNEVQILDTRFEIVERALKKKYPGLSLIDIMNSKMVTNAEGKAYSSKSSFHFMNDVMKDVMKKGIKVRSFDKNGGMRDDLVVQASDMGLFAAVSLSDYKEQFRKLKKELDGTNGNLTSNSITYDKLQTALDEAQKVLFDKEIGDVVVADSLKKVVKGEKGGTESIQRIYAALENVRNACDDYMLEHSFNKELSVRQRKRLRPIHGLKLLFNQFKACEGRPSECYKDIIAERIAYSAAISFYNMKGRMNRDKTYRMDGIDRLTSAIGHKDAIDKIKSGTVIDEMLNGLNDADKKALLSKSDNELANKYIETLAAQGERAMKKQAKLEQTKVNTNEVKQL